MLLMHLMPWALVFALAKAGSSMPARMAIMAITTSSSINVNAGVALLRRAERLEFMPRADGIDAWCFCNRLNALYRWPSRPKPGQTGNEARLLFCWKATFPTEVHGRMALGVVYRRGRRDVRSCDKCFRQ